MARKLYIEVGGVAHKIKRLYCEAGGVAHKVKKLYTEVNGVSKLVYNSFNPFTYTFSTHPDGSPILSDYCEMYTWYAGFDPDGTIRLECSLWTATKVTSGAPAARVTLGYVNPAELVGKTITVTYNKDFPTEYSYNYFTCWGVTSYGGYSDHHYITASDGNGLTFSHVVSANEVGFYMQIVSGSDDGWGGDIVITSIKVDGEEVLR